MNCKKIANKVNEIVERHPFAFFSLLMCFIAVFTYRQYLFGNKIFVFSTYEDSIGQTYPYHLYYARRVENGEAGSLCPQSARSRRSASCCQRYAVFGRRIHRA